MGNLAITTYCAICHTYQQAKIVSTDWDNMKNMHRPVSTEELRSLEATVRCTVCHTEKSVKRHSEDYDTLTIWHKLPSS